MLRPAVGLLSTLSCLLCLICTTSIPKTHTQQASTQAPQRSLTQPPATLDRWRFSDDLLTVSETLPTHASAQRDVKATAFTADTTPGLASAGLRRLQTSGYRRRGSGGFNRRPRQAGNDYEAEPEDHKLAEREQQGSLIGGQVAAAGQAGTNTTSSFKQSTVDAKQLAASSGAPTPHNVWLYSLISADYEGAALLQHWITHYLLIGIEKERFLLLVNHNPANAGVQRAHLAEVLSILQQAGLGYRLWIGQYSSEGHLKLKLQILRDVIADPEDWIVMVDSDEFQIYSDPDVRRFLGECERQGQNWVRGFLQDRVSQTGDLLPIRPDVSIFEQFPRHCNVLRNTSGGKRKKVAAFKAYLRSNQGNHKLVQPEAAKQYFGPSQPGELGPRGGLLGGENLYPLTPYYTYHTRYMYPLTPNGTSGLWTPVMSSYFCLIQHFKWHHGVVRSVQDRLVYYKGDYNEQQGTGLPRYAHYIESQRILETVLAAGKIQVEEVECEKRANNPRYKAHS